MAYFLGHPVQNCKRETDSEQCIHAKLILQYQRLQYIPMHKLIAQLLQPNATTQIIKNIALS